MSIEDAGGGISPSPSPIRLPALCALCLSPSRGTAGYLPGTARSPSSSGTRHGTASTPRRSSPAPWPRCAVSPEPHQSLQPAATHWDTKPTLPSLPAAVPRGSPNRLPASPRCSAASPQHPPEGQDHTQSQDRARSQWVKAPQCQPCRPAGHPSLSLTGTEENRHIQARWTRLRRCPDLSPSLMAVPGGPGPMLPAAGC